MGCHCKHRISIDSLLNLFWNNLIIREKTFDEIVDIIRTKKTGTIEITKKKWDLFIDLLLTNPDYKDISKQYFNKVLNESRKRKNEGLLFLSILFLGKGNDLELTKSFLSIALTQGGLNNSIYLNMNNRNNLIRKKDLNDVIFFYIEMISLMCIDCLSSISDNKENFINELNKSFCLDNLEKFIQLRIFENYCFDDLIDIENFIREKHNILSNDSFIRDWLLQYINNSKLSES
jgi:hypothetical protein